MKHSALKWVKVTIDDSLKQTRQALEQFVENPNDTAPLQQCVGWLHEVRGVLSMMELQTAALLVQEVEHTIQALLNSQIDNNEKTYDVLMRALVQLPNYLDHLAIVKSDIPLALLNLLNSLRTLRQQKALSAINLFTPDIHTPIPLGKAAKLPDDKFKAFMKQMFAAYQKGLAVLIKHPKQADGPKYLYSVMQRLQQATGAAPVTHVWWITEAILEALLQKGLEVSNSIATLLKQIASLLKQLAENGHAALNTPPPKSLLINLLYYCAQARSKGKHLALVKETFHLDDYFPSEAQLQVAHLIFSGPDIELMNTIVTLLKDDFARVEETLDIFNRADSPSVSELAPLVDILRNMAYTLGILGLTVQSESMLAQAQAIETLTQNTEPPELATLLVIANALLKIDAALDILAVQGVHARQRLQQSLDTDFSETPQFKIVLTAVVNEAKTELAQVVQPLVSFIDNREMTQELQDVPIHLSLIQGFLSMVSHEKAAKLLTLCSQYIEKTFIQAANVPGEEKLKALADVLLSMELYLDTIAGNPMDARDILDLTQKRLTILVN